MEISKQDIIQIDNIKYIVLTSMHYLDREYFFVNELDNVKDMKLFQYLVPIFQQKVKEEISNL